MTFLRATRARQARRRFRTRDPATLGDLTTQRLALFSSRFVTLWERERERERSVSSSSPEAQKRSLSSRRARVSIRSLCLFATQRVAAVFSEADAQRPHLATKRFVRHYEQLLRRATPPRGYSSRTFPILLLPYVFVFFSSDPCERRGRLVFFFSEAWREEGSGARVPRGSRKKRA